MDQSDVIAAWWDTLATEQRVNAKTAVERGALPHWMARSLTERLGTAVVSTWFDGDPNDHPAPFRATPEIATLIAAQEG